MPQWGRPITRPLTVTALTRDTMLVICDLWESIGPGPATLLLHAGGRITSRRAGLVRPWRLLAAAVPAGTFVRLVLVASRAGAAA